MTNMESKMMFEKPCVQPEDIDITTFCLLREQEMDDCDRLLQYIKRFLQAQMSLEAFQGSIPSYSQIEYGYEYFLTQKELFLSKAVKQILYLNTISANLLGMRFLNRKVDKSDFQQCVALLYAFDRAMWDKLHINVEDEDWQLFHRRIKIA